MRKVAAHLVAGVFTVVIFPALSFAQFGAIAGVVRDDTGAVLPGVTAEAASPALIEKVRTAVSDGAGQYTVEQLRPGVYTITFTLPGFSIVRREGIQISAGFTAPVNVSLKVGSVEETITVSGEAPVVDVQSISQQRTLAKEALDALPTARSFATLGTALPGVSANQRDVGGTLGERGNVLSAHGGNPFDMTVQIDGIAIGNMGGTSGSAWSNFSLNDAATQEIAFETGAISAEVGSGGVRVNVIPREGGNTFNGLVFGNYANRGMSRSNFTDELKARGARAPAGFDRLWDESAAFGGPLRPDRVWFFAAHRYKGNDLIGTDSHFEKNPNDWVYDPDLSRPLHGGGFDMDNQLRVTGQLTPRNKISAFYDKMNKCNCPVTNPGPTASGESGTRLTYPPTWLVSLGWQATISPRLLWDSAVSYNRQATGSDVQPGTGITATSPISAVEATTGRRFRAPFTTGGGVQHQKYVRGALSYVTGSHATKVGVTWHNGDRAGLSNTLSDSWSFTLFNGLPQSVTLTTAPYVTQYKLNSDIGVFAQDKWTIRRLTVTGGLRFDYFNAKVPVSTSPGGRWIGARSFPEVPNVPNWKDISPRVGVSYDLFGNGKTAVKASVSRYVTGQVFAFTNNVDPFTTTVNSATRTWNDANGNFIPEGDPLNPLPNGEFLGTINPNFGKSIITTRYDPDVSEGWGKRPYNWEYSASVQHELLPRVSMEVAYYRRTFGNFTVTENLDVTPADFNEFCITAPSDARLGDVSGSRICGLYDVTPAKAGLASNQIITFAKNYAGDTSQTFDGVDVSMNARLSGRLFLAAGFSTGRTVTKACAQVDNPGTLRFCETTPPFQGSSRVSGAYTFPWDLQVSGVFQNVPPASVTSVALYPARNADAAASLGRPIATPGGVINAALIDPSTYTEFGEYVNQLDLRLTKGVRIGRYRLEAMADFYNVLNVSTILTYTSAYGPTWLAPTLILQSSYIKLGGRFTF